MFSKCQNDLYKSLDDVSRGVFRTHWEIYDGAFFKKINNAWKPRFPQKSSIIYVWQGSQYTSGIQFSIQFTRALRRTKLLEGDAALS